MEPIAAQARYCLSQSLPDIARKKWTGRSRTLWGLGRRLPLKFRRADYSLKSSSCSKLLLIRRILFGVVSELFVVRIIRGFFHNTSPKLGTSGFQRERSSTARAQPITHRQSSVQIDAEDYPICGAPPPREPLTYNEPLCPCLDDINPSVCKLKSRYFYLGSFLQYTESRPVYLEIHDVVPARTPYAAHSGPNRVR